MKTKARRGGRDMLRVMTVFDAEMSAREKQEWKADLEARLQQIESSDQQRDENINQWELTKAGTP